MPGTGFIESHALLQWAVARRPTLLRVLLWCGILGSSACVLVGIWLLVGGPVSFARLDRRIESARFIALYIGPLILAVSYWARLRVRNIDRIPGVILVADIAVMGFSLARFVLGHRVP
jgi:hypothetical protein